MDHAGRLRQAIADRSAKVGVIGLGYVGLPLVELFAGKGFAVLGLDIDARKIALLQAGQSYIGHISSERVGALHAGGRFDATADFSRLPEVDAVLICVPTPLGPHHEPDLSCVVDTGRTIGRFLKPGQLVVLESTTYPGTTRDVLLPELEAGGLAAGRDFFLAYSPEREDPGNPRYSAATIPKVVGGFDETSGELARSLYGAAVPQVVPTSSCEVAEACKILENTYRAVNIALVNELKIVFERMGIDIWEVIDAAKTKPFGFQAFYPGPGLGGHCLGGSETVRVRSHSLDSVLPLADLFEHSRRETQLLRLGDLEVIEPEQLETLSIDPQTGKTGWRRVSLLFRRRYRGAMREIQLAGNRTLRTTDRHPMLVVEEDRLVVRDARALKPGDRVPLFNGFSTACVARQEDPCVDLLAVLPESLIERLHVRLLDVSWGQYEPTLKTRYGWTIRDSIRKNSLPARRYLELEKELEIGRDRIVLLSGRGASHTSFPALLRVNPDVCRLIGYFLSEGCITEERGNPRVRFTFHRDEREYIEDVGEILKTLGVSTTAHHDKTWRSTTLRAGSIILGHVLRDVLRTGVSSRTMRIPALVMGGSAEHHEQVLAGLLRGDGDVDVHVGPRAYSKRGHSYEHEFNTGQVGYFSSSPELLSQVDFLLQEMGLHARRKKGKPHLRLAGQESLLRLKPLLAAGKAHRLHRLEASRKRPGAARAVRAWSEGRSLAVIRVTPTSAEEEWVYSLEVPEMHTFATTGGIFVHNCIPIDPFYLTWIARAHGLHTRFIELAGEINTSMPHHVIDRVMAALNDRGKPLKGSRLLVLGAAYKPNVDDCRESPAVEMMELLEARGAIVSYSDPHVAVLPPLRGHSIRLESVPLSPDVLAAADCVLVATDHAQFDWAAITRHASLIIDTRGATRAVAPGGAANIVTA